ncbi:MAG: tetratricopeptide repeat protein, partial [Planctomycetales bacterium]|nr:tetratricopeptide repeat protein [Planctomycetales bacterium]
LKLKPDDAEALNNLANVQIRLKDPSAVKTAETALASAPGNALVTDTLGWALFQNGQTEKALQMLRDARLRQPSNPDIRYHLAAVLAHTGRKTEARAELDAALLSGGAFENVSDARSLKQSLQ